MSSFFNVSSLAGNVFSTPVGQRIGKLFRLKINEFAFVLFRFFILSVAHSSFALQINFHAFCHEKLWNHFNSNKHFPLDICVCVFVFSMVSKNDTIFVVKQSIYKMYPIANKSPPPSINYGIVTARYMIRYSHFE